jgi:hypothetical protein
MATGQVRPGTSSCDLDSNIVANNVILCERCFKMKEELKVILNKLETAQLIIEMLQDEAKAQSRDSGRIPATNEWLMEADLEGDRG